MAVFRLQVPERTRDPFITVENQLKAGRHVFRLVVVNDRGVASDPMDAVVTVRDPATPTGGTITGTITGPIGGTITGPIIR